MRIVYIVTISLSAINFSVRLKSQDDQDEKSGHFYLCLISESRLNIQETVSTAFSKGGKFLKKLSGCVGGRV